LLKDISHSHVSANIQFGKNITRMMYFSIFKKNKKKHFNVSDKNYVVLLFSIISIKDIYS